VALAGAKAAAIITLCVPGALKLLHIAIYEYELENGPLQRVTNL
jgi:hypothetical protein